MGQSDLKGLFIVGFIFMAALFIWALVARADQGHAILSISMCLVAYFIGLGISKRNIG